MNQIDYNQAYTLALAAAKAEFDTVHPEFAKLNARILALKTTMRGLSQLLNEELEEIYTFQPRVITHGGSEVKTRRK